MGPRARDVLQQVTGDDVSNDGFPFGSWREIRIAGAPVRALRVTYVGELGWELHVPSEYAQTVYDALTQAGPAPRPGASRATARSNRSVWKRAIAPGAPTSAPITRRSRPAFGFAVKLASDQPFLGREALLRQQQEGLKKRLCRLHGRRSRRGPARPRDDLSRRPSGSAGSPQAASATRSTRRSATATSAIPQASTSTTSNPGATSSRSRPRGCRPPCTSAPSTIRTWCG